MLLAAILMQQVICPFAVFFFPLVLFPLRPFLNIHSLHYTFNHQFYCFVKGLLFSEWIVAHGLCVTVRMKKITAVGERAFEQTLQICQLIFIKHIFFFCGNFQFYSLNERSKGLIECYINRLPALVKPLIIGEMKCSQIAHTSERLLASSYFLTTNDKCFTSNMRFALNFKCACCFAVVFKMNMIYHRCQVFALWEER